MTFIVFDPEDSWAASQCPSEADLKDCLSNIFGRRSFPTVLEYEIDGYCRNVTDEKRKLYGPKPAPDEYQEYENWTRPHTRLMARSGAFGRR